MRERVTNVLFLCTGNSARSILAEALLNAHGEGRFRAYSAGSQPTGRVHPMALAVLAEEGLPAAGAASKSWDTFAGPGAPPMHYVFTVCDSAAAEACPVWPAAPVRAHWGIPDPAAAVGSEAQRMEAFRSALLQLEKRIQSFLALPFDMLDERALQRALSAIGHQD